LPEERKSNKGGTLTLPIAPMQEAKNGKLICVNPSELEPGYRIKLEYSEAIVGYFDVMGLKSKTNADDIRDTLADFAGALYRPAETFSGIRFKIFSDCAFIAAPIERIKDFISIVRYAFRQWTLDGIFVRGGVATGSYSEFNCINDDMPLKNFEWSFFAGTAMVKAVECERNGVGSLLFVSYDCANLLSSVASEPIIAVGKSRIIGWTDDNSTLYRYLCYSLLRLLRILSNENGEKERVALHFITNIRYTLTMNPKMKVFILCILSLPKLNTIARRKALEIFKIIEPEDFDAIRNMIDDFIGDTERIRELIAMADYDSSITGSAISP
jgi:hypothetical protein